jgi:Ca2+-binding EF-hand superfamily protein
MIKRRNISTLLLLAASTNLINSQPSKSSIPPPGKTDQPLGDALHQMLDSNKDYVVTMPEVNAQLAMLEMLFDKSADMDKEGRENKKYMSSKDMLAGVKSAAPTLFALMDADSNGKVTKQELEFATKFELSLKKDGGMRDLLRDVFFIIDGDGDDQLNADELLKAGQGAKAISDITHRFHKLFPIRNTPGELEVFVKKTIDSFGGTNSLDKESVEKGMKWIDADGDGFISRKEVGKFYNAAGKQFMDTSQAVKVMGPMMQLFGGSDMGALFNNMNTGAGASKGRAGAAGGRGGGFKMDL